ncbi:HAMP domain-containing sensor histidine kinase [Aureimonas sp. AU12]|uniref:sensor histidine kinase n=1 Tax=Aureimonas sp. AU12 TaxID=1638161 RepID=UPI000781ACDC|nr:ATP-binding protein [Aureimonas sp. AU12]
MSVAAPPSFDKSAARGRRASRDVELARTVRSARDRLTSSSGLPPRIELELLDRHVELQTRWLPFSILPFVAASGLLALGSVDEAAIFATVTLVCCALSVFVFDRFERAQRRVFEVVRWTRTFAAAQVAIGMPWAVLVLWPACESCGPGASYLARLAPVLGAMALTALGGFALGHAIPLTFLPLCGALVYRLTIDGDDPLALTTDGILLAAVPFFAVVAGRLRGALVERCRHRTERDQLVSEIETARIYSDDARRRAEEASLAKSRFLATMSHELRTPLNAILGFSEVITNEILGPVGNPTYKEYVQDIHSSGQHLLDLINEILDLSRVEAGRYTLNEEAVDLVGVASGCIAYVQMKADAKSVTIVEQFEHGLPQLWGDPRSLRQVVLNLLSNAVKFTPNGGRVVLRVGWTAGGGQYVSIRDNGPGIPAEEIPTVLSSFGQGSSAIKSAEQGTGLGLPIVQALVKLHDGEFELHSKLREGTEVLAIFPHSRVLEVMPALTEFG